MTPGTDAVPPPRFGEPAQAEVEIHIVGNEAVRMSDDLVARLDKVTDHKGAILRMIGVFYAARDKDLLVQERGGESRAVQDLWK